MAEYHLETMTPSKTDTLEEQQPSIEVTAAKQFNFARHWRNKITPILDDPFVVKALILGMQRHDSSYKENDPPWLFGRGPLNGQRARQGCLSWYQPWGLCHYIAPFSWAVGKKMYPDLNWGFITSDAHTIAIGYRHDWKDPQLVFDILLFREFSAQQSIEFAKGHGWRFYRSLAWYAAWFCYEPETAFELLSNQGIV